MNSNQAPIIIAAAVSGLVCLLIGVTAAYFLLAPAPSPPPQNGATQGNASREPAQHPGPEREQPETPGRPEPAELQEQINDLRRGNSALVAERDALRREKEGLEQKIGKLEVELAAVRASEASRRGKLAVNFGNHGELEELQTTDWKELGQALQSITPQIAAMGEAIRAGKPIDRDAMEKIGRDNLKMIKLAAALEGKLPTHAGNANGEYTHPVAQANMLAAHLEAVGDPLSDDQRLRLAELGEEYERRWKTLQQGYTDDTLRLQKILDETDLKVWFTERMFAVTTPQQKAKVVDPSIEGILQFDVYSPGLMLVLAVETIRVTDKDAVKANFKDWLAPKLDVGRELLEGIEYAFDEWRGKLPLEPVNTAQSRMVPIQHALQAGRAQLALLQTLAATALSSPEQRKKVQQCKSFGMPQLVKQD